MSEPPGDAAAIKLADVRTIADASDWLRVRAAGFAAAENLTRSPADAKGFGLAASTIEGLAELMGMTDAKTAAGTLLTMGTDYGAGGQRPGRTTRTGVLATLRTSGQNVRRARRPTKRRHPAQIRPERHAAYARHGSPAVTTRTLTRNDSKHRRATARRPTRRRSADFV